MQVDGEQTQALAENQTRTVPKQLGSKTKYEQK